MWLREEAKVKNFNDFFAYLGLERHNCMKAACMGNCPHEKCLRNREVVHNPEGYNMKFRKKLMELMFNYKLKYGKK